ncbi:MULTISPECIES: hypothetical protein [Dickeya]|uniref:Plasmid transfer protein n=1 Tax=Dickeya oryzae TaxID=1240404 RepID=A0AB39IQQ0_9GAMM|nr:MULTISPECIES: hypothetical protein [Dickeya]MCA6985488.1 hypothetical protein [Dickeya zeae]MCA6990815.1 hypothetical protein [Dickeya oryzae]
MTTETLTEAATSFSVEEPAVSPAVSSLPDEKPVKNGFIFRQSRESKSTPPFASLLMTIWRVGKVVIITASLACNAYLLNELSLQQIRMTSLEAAFRAGNLSKLSESIATIEGRLTLSRQDAQALADRVTTVEQSRNAVQQQVAENTQSIQRLSTAQAAERQALETLQLQFNALSDWKEQWSKMTADRKAEKSATTSTTEGASAAKETVKKKSLTRGPRIREQDKSLSPPFVVNGVERRGGQMFLVASPADAPTSLSQVRLLSPGDSLSGWTLTAVDGGQAHFTVNGHSQSIPLR